MPSGCRRVSTFQGFDKADYVEKLSTKLGNLPDHAIFFTLGTHPFKVNLDGSKLIEILLQVK